MHNGQSPDDKDVMVQMGPTRKSWSRRLLWAAVLFPFFYSTAKTATDIQEGGLDSLDVLRGLGRIVLLFASVLVGSRLRRFSGLGLRALIAFCVIALISSMWSVDMRATALKAVILAVFYVSMVRLIATYPSREAALRGVATMVHVLLVLIALQWMILPGLTYAVDPITGLRRLNGLFPSISANPLSYMCLVGIVAALLKIGPAWAVPSLSVLRETPRASGFGL
jgi:hypothetical protein